MTPPSRPFVHGVAFDAEEWIPLRLLEASLSWENGSQSFINTPCSK